MIWDKIAVVLAIVVALLITALGTTGYMLNNAYKEVASERVKVSECQASLGNLTAIVDKANAELKKLQVESKHYNATQQRLQNELNKAYSIFNNAVTCEGVVSNVEQAFSLMLLRLQNLSNEVTND